MTQCNGTSLCTEICKCIFPSCHDSPCKCCITCWLLIKVMDHAMSLNWMCCPIPHVQKKLLWHKWFPVAACFIVSAVTESDLSQDRMTRPSTIAWCSYVSVISADKDSECSLCFHFKWDHWKYCICPPKTASLACIQSITQKADQY